ncbi:hypothetical protein ACJIZ3_011488 [Penstemon smallii]|uniref:FAD-binding domain-containing protein n=1 Tax=Penstemon smallii TaxID=265156 RepID=A0ABD3UJ90_9LAMI
MEVVENVVIVGAGIAGLATSLGLHRLGIKSLVLESSDKLRSEGFCFATWTNAWRALDALGVGAILRANHRELTGIVSTSTITGLTTAQVSFNDIYLPSDHEFRCVNRKVLMGTMEKELPKGTIRYSSKVVQIQDSGFYKSIHFADGKILKTKVLIGCDGVNSVVAKYLGFSKPYFLGRSAIRGFVEFEDGHGLELKSMHFVGEGVKYGIIPTDDHGVYWFFSKDKDIEEDPAKMKEYILRNLGKVPDKIRGVFEKTDLNSIICSPLRLRLPWELLYGNISRDNVCVAGDALHAMTPDIGQGACSSLEDSVVLARVLGEVLMEKSSGLRQENDVENEHRRIGNGLEKFARERRWRSFDLVLTSYIVGFIRQSDGVVMKYLRDGMLAKFLGGIGLKKSIFDCGKLNVN